MCKGGTENSVFLKGQWLRLGHSLANMHIFNQGICKSGRAASFKETALVLSQAGSATELYLILTVPENTTVTSQKRANGTLCPRCLSQELGLRELLCTVRWEPQSGLMGIYLLDLPQIRRMLL